MNGCCAFIMPSIRARGVPAARAVRKDDPPLWWTYEHVDVLEAIRNRRSIGKVSGDVTEEQLTLPVHGLELGADERITGVVYLGMPAMPAPATSPRDVAGPA